MKDLAALGLTLSSESDHRVAAVLAPPGVQAGVYQFGAEVPFVDAAGAPLGSGPRRVELVSDWAALLPDATLWQRPVDAGAVADLASPINRELAELIASLWGAFGSIAWSSRAPDHNPDLGPHQIAVAWCGAVAVAAVAPTRRAAPPRGEAEAAPIADVQNGGA